MLSTKETQTVTAPRPKAVKKQSRIPTYGSSPTAATQEGRKDAATQAEVATDGSSKMTLLRRRKGPSASLSVWLHVSEYDKKTLLRALERTEQSNMAYIGANGRLQQQVESLKYYLKQKAEEVQDQYIVNSMLFDRLSMAQDTNTKLLAHNAVMAGVLGDLLGRGDVLNAEQQRLLAPILGAPRATLQRGGPTEAAGGSSGSSSMVIDAEGQEEEEDALATVVPQKPGDEEEQAVLPLAVDPLVYALTRDAVRGAKKRTGSPGLQHPANKKGKLELP